MTSDSHALSGAYAVDALDDAERVEFEAHLAECPACRAEVTSLQEAASLLAETTMVGPSADLRARILADITTVRPLPPEVPDSPAPTATVTQLAPRRRRRARAFLAAAAAAVAIGTGGIVATQLNDDAPSRTDQVLEAGDAKRFEQTLPDGGTATLIVSKKQNAAVLVTHDMTAAPAGYTYALWLQHDDQMVPAGVMPEGEDNEVLLSGDAATANGAAVSVEEAGTDLTEPLGDVVASFTFA